jgi:L-amino acid N-acyltransferase YncA
MGKKIGYALLTTTLNFCSQHGYQTVLSVVEAAKEATILYRKTGMIELGAFIGKNTGVKCLVFITEQNRNLSNLYT